MDKRQDAEALENNGLPRRVGLALTLPHAPPNGALEPVMNTQVAYSYDFGRQDAHDDFRHGLISLSCGLRAEQLMEYVKDKQHSLFPDAFWDGYVAGLIELGFPA